MSTRSLSGPMYAGSCGGARGLYTGVPVRGTGFVSERRAATRRGVLNVSPPDKHGFCTLGVAVDVARAAFETAKCVVAQINPQMPRTQGDALIHVNEIDHYGRGG